MWAVSRMKWSPPLLFWQGLMRAACDGFSTFNAQDLANCISAGVLLVGVLLTDRDCTARPHRSGPWGSCQKHRRLCRLIRS